MADQLALFRICSVALCERMANVPGSARGFCGPHYRGGEHSMANCQAAHLVCNLRKRAKVAA